MYTFPRFGILCQEKSGNPGQNMRVEKKTRIIIILVSEQKHQSFKLIKRFGALNLQNDHLSKQARIKKCLGNIYLCVCSLITNATF
jgi:hypothetical protein